jgi:hypothetical protein
VLAAIDKKDKPIHYKDPEANYQRKLNWVASRLVVLYDLEDNRAWLIDGASTLLHLVRASIKDYERGPFRFYSLFKPEEMEEADTALSGKDAAIAVLNNDNNRSLKLYKDNFGEMAIGDGESKKKKTHFCFEDRVIELYPTLEKALDYQANAEAEDGIGFRMNCTPWQQLEGFDFMDLATSRSPIWPRVATLGVTGKGWADFTRAIHATTLFGRRFGELIKPVDANGLCPSWVEVPKKKECLAICVSNIKEILMVRESAQTNPLRLINNIYWHKPDKIFEACQCAAGDPGKNCDRVQALLPLWFPTLLGRGFKNPGKLEDRGAVIFGHTWRIPLSWARPKEPDTLPNDSGIESGRGLSTARGNVLSAASSSQQLLGEGLSSELLPGPAASDCSTSEYLQVAAT